MADYTKKDLVNDLAELDVIFETKKQARETIEFIIAKIKAEVVAGNKVNLSGLCHFKPAIQAEKSGGVPGKPDQIYLSPAKNVVRISPAKPFKDILNG